MEDFILLFTFTQSGENRNRNVVGARVVVFLSYKESKSETFSQLVQRVKYGGSL